MAAASRKGSSSVEASLPSESKEEPIRCGECRKLVTDKGIQCEICELWFHCKCENVAEETYKLMNQDRVHYYCGRCDKAVGKMLKTVMEVQTRQKKLEDEFHKMQQDIEKKNYVRQEQIEKLEEKTRKMVKDEIAKRQEEIKAQVDNSLKKMVTTQGEGTLWSEIVAKHVDDRFMVISSDLVETKTKIDETREKLSEDLEKMKKKNNVIVYNVPESDASTYKDKVSADKKFCEDLMTDALKVGFEEGNIKQLYRLGKKIEGKRRPLLVEFEDGQTKNLVMEHAGRLAVAAEKFAGVVISHDMTKNERLQCKQLVAEAKKQQTEDGSGEWIYKVRGLPGQMKIIKIKKRY
jgi:chemotaxis regulatin CheY-phosphate phosphatase CheZ